VKYIVALDPGSDKCGYAVVRYDLVCMEKGVIFLAELGRVLRRLGSACPAPEAIVLGNGTAARATAALIADLDLGVPLRAGDERNTTYEARSRYFEEHPPRGFWRLVPCSLQMPPRPIDDYAAWLIGERYLQHHGLVESTDAAGSAGKS
jgi:RNase H-fold protein (predicted Holliday junction resolvase)